MIAFVKLLLFLVVASICVNANDSSDIIYPTEGTVWRVGEHVNVTFRETIPPRETVAIFFDNARGVTLAGGSLTQHVFKFIVPGEALSRPGSTSLLLAVRRENYYLSSVDSVNVKVIPELS